MLIEKILVTDSKRIMNDSFIVFMSLVPWIVALLVKITWLHVEKYYPMIKLDDYRLIVSLNVALLNPVSMGMVLGFQLLEEKEHGVFKAIAVTPLNNDYYLLYRFGVMSMLAAVMTFIAHEVLGLIALDLFGLLSIVMLASLQVPFQALLIASFARNTLEGFAVMKGTGFMLLVPLLLLHFFPENVLTWLAGILPFFG